MPWSEVASQGGEGDGNTGRVQRTFRVWGVHPSQVLNDPTSVIGGPGGTQPGYGAEGLPAIGSGLPEDPTLILDRYTVSPSTEVTFDAVALYSNDGRFRLDGNDEDESLPSPIEELGGGPEYVKVEIPFARRTMSVVSNETAGTTATLFGWEYDNFNVRESRWVIEATVRVEGQVGSLVDAVQAQHGKLHRINSKWYLFEAGRWKHDRDTGLTEFKYRFVRDRGTQVAGEIATPSPNLFVPGQLSTFPAITGPELFLRPPYCELKIISLETGPVAPGVTPALQVVVIAPYDIAGPGGTGQGWRTLPGIVDLIEP